MVAKKSKTGRRRTNRVRIRPHDAFDLIRLLARSQSDPRKAVAELVQNSLDAGARHIDLTWFNKEQERALRIRDDGEGVFPDLSREEALRRIAHTIGYSHKRDLTPAQRREQMVLGRYGIGLIGFWSVGRVLEMRSRVGGGPAWILRMFEDRAQGHVEPSRARKVVDEETWTEVTIFGVHPAAAGRIRPARLQAYLANELRGQLLERRAVVRITDRVARGRARKLYVVEPRPYLGRPLDAWRELDVPGFEPARVELYAVAPDEERRGVVSLACGGTVVLDDIAEIDGADQVREPWSRGLVEGVIDFPELYVAPGSRRGFAQNEPVAAFLVALAGLEKKLAEHLEEERKQRAARRRESLARDIRRAFRPVASRLPDYDFFAVRGGRGERPRDAKPAHPGAEADAGADGASSSGARGEPLAGTQAGPADPPAAPAGSEERSAVPPAAGAPASDGHLFPPGPLAEARVRPGRLRVAPLSTRGLRAQALDADGRPCGVGVVFTWSLQGPGDLESMGDRARYTAPDLDAVRDVDPVIRVVAVQGEIHATAEARVAIGLRGASDRRTSGIPEPQPVPAPGASWRSRLVDGRWEYNESHRDYLAASASQARRLRYLVNLFAKEIVLRNFGGPGDAEVLERMVEVLTYLDRGARRDG